MHKRARLPLCIFRFAFFALWAAAACSTKPPPPDLRPLRLPDLSHAAPSVQEQLREGVKDVVRTQAEVGIDIPSDGEYSKPSFSGYVTERLAGLELRPVERPAGPRPMNYPLLNEQFPNFMAQYNAMYRTIWMPPSIPRDLVDAAIQSGGSERANVVGPISYQPLIGGHMV